MVEFEIDHTCLGKDVSLDEIIETFLEADKYNLNLCIPGWSLEFLPLENFNNKVMAVVDFPLGQNNKNRKREQAYEYIKEYDIDEIDYCCNVSYIKNEDLNDKLYNEAKMMSSLSKPVKAIIETPLLSEEEIKIASGICSEAGVDYIKTCSGFFGGVEEKDVKIISNSLEDKSTKIKASGGISTRENAINLVNLGASRIGASSGVELLKD